MVRNAEVVGKSYPRFWSDLAEAGFTIVDANQPAESEEQAS